MTGQKTLTGHTQVLVLPRFYLLQETACCLLGKLEETIANVCSGASRCLNNVETDDLHRFSQDHVTTASQRNAA